MQKITQGRADICFMFSPFSKSIDVVSRDERVKITPVKRIDLRPYPRTAPRARMTRGSTRGRRSRGTSGGGRGRDRWKNVCDDVYVCARETRATVVCQYTLT